MNYVYILESAHEPNRHYIGLTPNLKQRFAEHNAGRSRHTSKYKPWNLAVYLGFADEKTAIEFERYLKSGSGRAFLARHLFRKKPPI